MRSGANPNRRVQDGDKHFLYCSDCETKLSKWEGKAKEKVFGPATQNRPIPGNYGPWLSRFACSLALRTIQSQFYRGNDSQSDPAPQCQLAAAEDKWKKFLTDEIKNPGKFQQYYIHLGYHDGFDAPNLPENWNTWVKRSVERDTVFIPDGNFIATFVKLGPIIFFGKIRDENLILGKEFLRCSDGRLPAASTLLNANTWKFFIDRANSQKRVMATMSDKQKEVVNAQVMKNPKDFWNSETAEALVKDYEQFRKK